MNKLLIVLLLFFCFQMEAQDSVALYEREKILPQQEVPVDSAAVELKTFPRNFKKKYSGDAFIYEYKTPKKNAWDRFKEWLAHLLQNIFRFSANETSVSVVTLILRVIAALIVIFVIYMIVKLVMNKEGRWILGRNSDAKILHYTEIEKNLQLVDFEELVRSTIRSGEKRLTIRYYYLWLLKKMAAAQWIVWDIEKTNSDYLHELQTQSQKDKFAYLSYLYNYIWYGEFELDEKTFDKARTAFETALKSIRNV